MKNYKVNTNYAMGEEPKGLAFGQWDNVKSWVMEKLNPVSNRVAAVETEITALQVALKRLEKSLASTDMKSQSIIDRVDAIALDIIKKNDLLKSNLEAVTKDMHTLKRSVDANSSGIISVTNRIEVTQQELKKFSVEQISIVEARIKKRVDLCEVKNSELSNELSTLNEEVKKWPAIHNAFKMEYGAFVKRQDERNENFTNDITLNKKDVGTAVNRLNSLSADFSNHVGDFKSQVKSFEKSQADFNEYKNSHQQIHSKQDADFANEKLRLDKTIADFKDHTVDYTLHKVPKDVAKARASARLEEKYGSQFLSKSSNQYEDKSNINSTKKVKLFDKFASFFKKKTENEKQAEKKEQKNAFLSSPMAPTMGGFGAIEKWYGGNQYTNTVERRRTWPGGNQFFNSSSGGFKNRYKSRGRGIAGRK